MSRTRTQGDHPLHPPAALVRTW
ncbi:uncharacterized protein METZ01_LOCUS372179, partial [marine metagenome]